MLTCARKYLGKYLKQVQEPMNQKTVTEHVCVCFYPNLWPNWQARQDYKLYSCNLIVTVQGKVKKHCKTYVFVNEVFVTVL